MLKVVEERDAREAGKEVLPLDEIARQGAVRMLMAALKAEVGLDPVSKTVLGSNEAGGPPMPGTPPPHPPEQRRRIVELAHAGRRINEWAREFEPSANSIRRWVRQAELDESLRSDGLTAGEREELKRLRREHRVPREAREILSKAAARCAQETGATPQRRAHSQEPNQAMPPLARMRRAPGVSPGGYYARLKRPAAARRASARNLRSRASGWDASGRPG